MEGLEPPAYRLTAGRSTIELQTNTSHYMKPQVGLEPHTGAHRRCSIMILSCLALRSADRNTIGHSLFPGARHITY